MTAPERRRDADSLHLAALCWNAQADSFETGFAYLTDHPAAERIALHLRECAREAVHAAREVEADETPCQEEDVREIGRTDDDYPQSLTIVRGDVA